MVGFTGRSGFRSGVGVVPDWADNWNLSQMKAETFFVPQHSYPERFKLPRAVDEAKDQRIIVTAVLKRAARRVKDELFRLKSALT